MEKRRIFETIATRFDISRELLKAKFKKLSKVDMLDKMNRRLTTMIILVRFFLAWLIVRAESARRCEGNASESVRYEEESGKILHFQN